MTKIEDEMENSVHDCWSVTTDISTILKYSDDIERDLLSLTDVYNVKFKKLMDDVDLLLEELHNIRDTYDELKPVFDKAGIVIDDMTLGAPRIDTDLFGNPTHIDNIYIGKFGEKDYE